MHNTFCYLILPSPGRPISCFCLICMLYKNRGFKSYLRNLRVLGFHPQSRSSECGERARASVRELSKLRRSGRWFPVREQRKICIGYLEKTPCCLTGRAGGERRETCCVLLYRNRTVLRPVGKCRGIQQASCRSLKLM